MGITGVITVEVDKSSVIDDIEYQFDKETPGKGYLTIYMKSGNAYMYHGVPIKKLGDMLLYRSAGKAYNELIRGKFPVVAIWDYNLCDIKGGW